MLGFGKRQEAVTTSQQDAPLSILTNESGSDCAWRQEEQGIDHGNGSHGICEAHNNQIRYQHVVRKFERVPSYAERFAKGR
jgi:hypothetical protein